MYIDHLFIYFRNMPNFGSMTLEHNQSTWTAHDPVNQQIDLFFTTYSAPAAGTHLASTVRYV
jgi:hypothetical protein